MNNQQQTRPKELVEKFLTAIDKHLDDIVTGKATELLDINEFASMLFVHPTHFSNTTKGLTGKSPCHFYQEKILETSCNLLVVTNTPIREIAFLLTYDPSNFTKLFKKFIGITPKQYREKLRVEGSFS